MVWLKIDDQVAHHPKFVEAGPIASWLWVCGNAHCNKYLTDGFIKTSELKTVGAVTNARKWAERLVVAGLWERVSGGYQVHDFHDFNPTAASVRAERAEKAECGRIGGVKSGEARRKQSASSKPEAPPSRSVEGAGVELPSRPVPSLEEKNVHTHRPAGPTSSGALGGMLPRDHLKHSWCGRKCVPEFLHLEFCRALGGELGAANDTLRGADRMSGWYLDVERRLGDKPNGDEPLKFWRAQFAAQWPGEQPKRAPAVSLVCPDMPPCPMGTTAHECQKRTTLAAGRRQQAS